MDSKEFNVSIENPCDEKWDSFSKNETGAYFGKGNMSH